MAEGMAAEVLIVRANIPPAYLAAKGLRSAVRHGAGLDMIPMQDATDAGVLVANVPGVNAATVAEHAIFAAIALRLRDDVASEPNQREANQRSAPAVERGLFLVPKVIE